MSLPQTARIVEVGARDGLQNHPDFVDTKTKIELIERLCDAGSKHIEVGAFVSPRWVPQMANSAEVIASLSKRDDVCYSVLTPNLKGMEAALQAKDEGAKLDEVAVFIAASESFSQKNTNCSIAEAVERAKPIIKLAIEQNIRVRGYVSCVMSCPYEGDNINPIVVADLCETLIRLGCFEVSLGDTNGRGNPLKTQALINTCKNKVDVTQLAVHFHNTYGQALSNIWAALSQGVATIDASVAGLGGCPYAKGATGNVATEDVLYMLQGSGIETGLNMDRMVDTALFITDAISAPLSSNTAKAIANARA